MKRYWFKRRRYGAGRIPVTWEGWLLVIVFFSFFVFAVSTFFKNSAQASLHDYRWFQWTVIIATLLFLTTVSKTSPKGKWRWGRKPKDNPKEDF
jgi:uncharacterized membrane protein YbhN (UPF0104 family)